MFKENASVVHKLGQHEFLDGVTDKCVHKTPMKDLINVLQKLQKKMITTYFQ